MFPLSALSSLSTTLRYLWESMFLPLFATFNVEPTGTFAIPFSRFRVSISTTRYLNLKSRLSVALLPSTWRVDSCTPKVSVFNTVPEDKRVAYGFAWVFPVWDVNVDEVTPFGSPSLTSTLEIIPVLSHTFSSGLNVAPR